ncbi:hypothetical protein TMEN_6048 [Trichophyton mentagrophytes]|uniref:Uncharacterized protein n=2 Tax=Trichophyton interdigitale TaxID=101480 RepID=A0A9P4YKQ6_9EURO|nr:hypothetical protein GY631_1902 [Trichophyton interdigitale]KAF3898317.1 hypothetical protein GY632_1853 [Trichophyton interdigitale]KAG8210405.1 hypothetical protein GTR04_2224 [Trichophyton interdigitale]KDB22144.1 hypothetical protein H109_05933 [Trichophyton interdigitale MR816]GBF63423.1 hypothetical protein TMEN_6048 [Trichophyton mentagrophytes]
MKLTTVFALVAFVPACLAAATGAEIPGPESPLEKRACRPSKCVCNKIQGQFCGNEKINPACTNGHVFECNKSTGKACDYGVRTSCRKCGKLSC